MRHMKYLNVILTVNAMLLTGLLWTAIVGQPLLAGEASAQSRTRDLRTDPSGQVTVRDPETGRWTRVGIPNAGAQRADMVRSLRGIEQAISELQETLRSGAVKAQITNLDEIRIEVE
jgi:hypothetical protein